VRSAVSRVLRKAGFEVLEARHGADALRLLAARDSRDGAVRLVVTDVVMPEMGGVELAQRLATRPASPALLLMTGYPERVESAAGRPRDMLAKPFTSEALIRAVRAALAGAAAAS
jgi:CheY-like chemotaxis protein